MSSEIHQINLCNRTSFLSAQVITSQSWLISPTAPTLFCYQIVPSGPSCSLTSAAMKFSHAVSGLDKWFTIIWSSDTYVERLRNYCCLAAFVDIQCSIICLSSLSVARLALLHRRVCCICARFDVDSSAADGESMPIHLHRNMFAHAIEVLPVGRHWCVLS